MTRLPRITSRELVKVVQKFGFVLSRQKGSHAVFKHSDGRRTTIPIHSKQIIGPGLLNKIIEKDLGINVEEFVKKLK